MRKKKLKDDEPMPESLEEQADVLEAEAPPEAPSPDFVNPETAPDGPPGEANMEEPAPPLEPEQQPLFGKADEIINVLETERSSVRLLISKAFETIIKKKGEIADLETRQANIDKAIADLRDFGGEAKPSSGPLFEAAPETVPTKDETKPAEGETIPEETGPDFPSGDQPFGSISEIPDVPATENTLPAYL